MSANDTVKFDIITESDPSRPAGGYKVTPPQPGASPYDFPVTLNVPANPGATVDFGTQQITFAANPNVAALAVFDGLTMASLYGDTLAQQTPNGHFVGVTAQYPIGTEIGFAANFTDGMLSSATIKVPQDQAYAYERVAHEYGHYMAAAAGFFNNVPSADHDWGRDMVGAEAAGGKLTKRRG